MPTPKITADDLASELVFTFTRSGGPGGQHVNKVSTKVNLRFDVVNSQLLNETQRARLLTKLKTKLTKEGVVVLTSQEGRSQLTNKEAVVAKLVALLTNAFKREVKRRPTKPTRASKEKRLDQKKQKAEKKESRKKL